MHFVFRQTCRICGSPAPTPVISLGEHVTTSVTFGSSLPAAHASAGDSAVSRQKLAKLTLYRATAARRSDCATRAAVFPSQRVIPCR